MPPPILYPGVLWGDMNSSPELVGATGEIPASCFGELQLLPAAGDLAGESSSLITVLAGFCEFAVCSVCDDGGPMSSNGVDGFFRCPRCLFNIWTRPSFVNGLGKTSSIPKSTSALIRLEAEVLENLP